MNIFEVKCPNCGKSLRVKDISTVYCIHCGTKLHIDDEASRTERSIRVVTDAINKVYDESNELKLEKERISIEKMKLRNEEKKKQNRGCLMIVGIIGLFFIALVLILSSIYGNMEVTNTVKIYAPSNSKDLKNENYEKVVRQFEDAGFTNIQIHKIEDLKIGILSSDGDVDSVTIEGKDEFDTYNSFDPNVKVVVYYHTFPEEDE